MNEFNQVYVGLDVHKATIAVAVARPGRSEPEYHGNIVNSDAAVRKLLLRRSGGSPDRRHARPVPLACFARHAFGGTSEAGFGLLPLHRTGLVQWQHPSSRVCEPVHSQLRR